MKESEMGWPSPGSPLDRLRHVRRMVRAIQPFENAILVTPAENDQVLSLNDEPRPLNTDLLIESLDLRIRVCSATVLTVSDLTDGRADKCVAEILYAHPETAAIIVVTADDNLSCRLFEPFDVFHRPALLEDGDVENESLRTGSVAEVLRSYLARVQPYWPAQSYIGHPASDLFDIVEQAARTAITGVVGSRKNVPEWRAARGMLNIAHATRIADLARSVLTGDSSGIERTITQLANRAMDS